jgi:hypothetical protein
MESIEMSGLPKIRKHLLPNQEEVPDEELEAYFFKQFNYISRQDGCDLAFDTVLYGAEKKKHGKIIFENVLTPTAGYNRRDYQPWMWCTISTALLMTLLFLFVFISYYCNLWFFRRDKYGHIH